jgi:hypothetical protein
MPLAPANITQRIKASALAHAERGTETMQSKQRTQAAGVGLPIEANLASQTSPSRPWTSATSILRWSCALLCVALATQSGVCATPLIEKGGFFTTAQDLSRLRSQASDPRLKLAYRQVHDAAETPIAKWEKFFPATQPEPSTDALMKFGLTADRDTTYNDVAIECALHPTSRNKRVLREMMISELGWRQRRNYWNGMGIHDGLETAEFLESYDIGNQFSVFRATDHAIIRDVMHQAGHFFELWLLGNPWSRMYSDKREQDFCLNFHVYSASTLSWIAMLYPDFPESTSWLRQSEAGMVEYLMNGVGEDGGYGEGSIGYARLTDQALMNFFIVSKRLGVADYLAIPAIADRLQKSLRWRLDLTAPDGNAFAVGDADRTSDAHVVLHTGGELLNDPALLWGASMMFDRAEHYSVLDTSPLFLAHLDMTREGTQPKQLSALYPFSGYAAFRSGWDSHANAFFFKFGTSYIGQRESQRSPVISGHAHEDALEVELHYRGIPMLVDGGRHGPYEKWVTYGGFSKATVAHSTVGLGNEWGYDRLDGQYAKHQADHGPDFTYERPQQNIGPTDTQLKAFADLGEVAYTSAKVRTYDAVEHQRSVIWFADDSLTILADHLESQQEQPYEWYLTPVGNPVGKGGALIFGDDLARLQVLPILPTDERSTTISRGTENVPPYYVDLIGAAPLERPTGRWSTFSLLVLQKKAKDTDFLNVLLPFIGEKNPWSIESVGASARRLTLNDKQVLVSGRSAEAPLTVNGQCGVVSQVKGQDQSYALMEGTELARQGQPLITSTLNTKAWAGRFPATVNALVSLQDKRASFDLRPWPGDDTLLLNPPLAVPGQEPTAMLLVSVSFRVNARPARMLIMHSYSEDLELNDPAWDKETDWPRDYHASLYKRMPLAFSYDAASSMATVLLEPGEHQIVWE